MRPHTPLRSARWARLLHSGSVGLGAALVVLGLWAGGFFTQARLSLTNIYYVDIPTSDTIALIAIDDASLQAYGASPSVWSRQVFADLIRQLEPAPPRVVAFDVLFAEPTDADAAFAEAIQRVRAGSGRVRTVMAAAGVDRSPVQSDLVPATAYTLAISPTAALRSVIDYVGYVNTFPDADRVIRRQSSLIALSEGIQPSFSLAIYLAYLRVPASAIEQVVMPGEGQLTLAGERELPTDAFGLWMGNYFGPARTPQRSTFPTYSLSAVVAGEVDPAVFADRIVLVGLMGNTGAEDKYFVPIGTGAHLMSGIEIHANAIETLLQNVPLREQSTRSQAVMIVVLALTASLVYAHLRWHAMLAVAAVMIAGFVLVAFVSFGTRREVLNLFHALLALLIPLLAHVLLNIAHETIQRQRAEFLLSSVRMLSQQRLALDKMAVHIADDLHTLTGARSGVLWLPGHDAPPGVYAWPPEQPPLTERSTPAQRLLHAITTSPPPLSPRALRSGEHLALPVIWQGHLRAVVFLAGTPRRLRQAVPTLERIAREIAPHLDNALLFVEVQRQRALLEAVLVSSPAGIAVVEPAGLVVRRANAAFTAMLPHPGEIVGCSLLSLLEAAGLSDALRTALHEGFLHAATLRQELHTHTRTVLMDAAMLPDHAAWVVILTDISTQAQLSALKTQMIRMASHDLRNPLVIGVMGFANLILQDPSPAAISDENRHYVEQIARSGSEMLSIITDILSLEQIREGLLKRSPARLSEMVQSVVEQQADEIQRRQQRCTLDIEPWPTEIMVDARKLRQAISNLVTNAIKYTPDGGDITVRLRHAAEKVVLEVEDTGFGIPEWAQKNLFDEFYRATTAATAHIQGTGLGLSIVKSVVEAHGGEVWCCSAEGAGSTFGFWLPTVHPTADDDEVPEKCGTS